MFEDPTSDGRRGNSERRTERRKNDGFGQLSARSRHRRVSRTSSYPCDAQLEYELCLADNFGARSGRSRAPPSSRPFVASY